MYTPDKPFLAQIRQEIITTWDTPYVGIKDDGGGYPVIFRRIDEPEIDHTDGIGTKGVYHWRNRSFGFAVQDALAMNLNDLITVGAVPYKLQNHLILPKEDQDAIYVIIKELARECRSRNIAITGGETSIQWNLSGMELSLCVTGFLSDFNSHQFVTGDWLIGLKSSGLHSNGLTRAADVLPDTNLLALTEPTIIYSDMVGAILAEYKVNGMVHLAGGAYSRIKKKLSSVQNAEIAIGNDIPSVFFALHEGGNISDTEMYKTFNCGIGFVLGMPQKDAEEVLRDNEEAVHIGRIVDGNGLVRIQSSFRDMKVVI